VPVVSVSELLMRGAKLKCVPRKVSAASNGFENGERLKDWKDQYCEMIPQCSVSSNGERCPFDGAEIRDSGGQIIRAALITWNMSSPRRLSALYALNGP